MVDQTPLIFCALDTDNLEHACDLARQIGPVTGGLKLGLEFFSRFGSQGVESVREACPDAQLFLDMKYHDIPNTVAGAVRTISHNLAPAYLNVHASGGLEMMVAAQEACASQTKLLAVTVLTSMDKNDLIQTGVHYDPADQVQRLADLTVQAELDGVVCSAHEIQMLRRCFGSDLTLMVPGIRPAGSHTGDQKRIMAPKEAVQMGATHLVIGRPITASDHPESTAQSILDGIGSS